MSVEVVGGVPLNATIDIAAFDGSYKVAVSKRALARG